MLVICLVFTGILRLSAQPETGRQLDSLRGLLQKSKADTNRVGYLNAISNLFLFKTGATPSEKDSAFLYATVAQTLGRHLHDAKGCGDSYMTLSRFWRDKKDTAKGKEVCVQGH